jgi:hypothetical protein
MSGHPQERAFSEVAEGPTKDIVNRPTACSVFSNPQNWRARRGYGPAATAVFWSSYLGVVALTAALAAAPTERTPATYISTTLSKLSS